MKNFKASYVFGASLLLALLLVATTAFAQGRIFLSIGTGTTGGTYYPVGGAMAKIWSDKIPNVRATVQSTGGTIQNIQLMADKQTEAGFTDTRYVFAFRGRGPQFEGKPHTWLRGLVPLYPEPVNVIALRDSGIKTLADLRGKRVSIGAVGSGTEATSREFFGVLGMDVAKDIRPFMLGTGETSSALQDKRIDAAILVGSLGLSALVEITSLGLVDFLEVDDATFRALKKANETWVQFTIPANFYKNQPRPVKTYSGFNILSVRQDLPEELAYQMTKTLFENKADLVAVRATMENMTLENVHQIEIPLHPGAIRYYRERGVKLH